MKRNVSVSDKHAFLIMAHKADYTFFTLLKMLDDKRNDIYIHMDEKVNSYDSAKTENSLSYSKIYHIERKKVTWGGYSQIDTELRLLKAAVKNGHYIYYHLLSGEDLPIKTQDFIHDFFKEHSGKEFVCFQESKFQFAERVRYYYFFQEREGRKRNLYSVLRKASIAIQKLIGIKRNKDIQFQKGANWFSITDDLARYVCHRSNWIFETFKNTIFCDEIFLQTIVHNSRFKKTYIIRIMTTIMLHVYD